MKEEVNEMTNYTNTINQFKDTDCGRYGKAFEINVKQYVNGNRGNSHKVSAKGKIDFHFKNKKYEVKSNCGELDGIEKNSFVVYSMDNKYDYDKPDRALVFTPEDFMQAIKECGLLRTKKSTAGTIKTAIQSYNNSKKKTTQFRETLERYATCRLSTILTW